MAISFPTPASTLVVIDPRVEDYQTLVAGVVPGANILLLAPGEDGIEQITRAISLIPTDSIHIISHGSPGCLYLGNERLGLETLERYAATLQAWNGVKQIALYGCNVAAGDAGEEFLTKLHHITGATIHASTTKIGNASLDGDWHLDFTTDASAEGQIAISPRAQANYQGVLEVLTEDADLDFEITAVSEAQTAINSLFGADVSSLVSNASLIGGGSTLATTQVAFATDLDQITDTGGNAGAFADFSTGVVFSSGFLNVLTEANTADNIGAAGGGSGVSDPDFGDPGDIFDTAVLEFDITVPEAVTLTGRYIFASDEYLEFVNSGFNDSARILVNGTNVALAADGREVAIDNINDVENAAQFVNNPFVGGTVNFEPDGFTTTLEFSATLNAGTNTIRLGVADFGDNGFDSFFFFQADSFALAPTVVIDEDANNDGFISNDELNGDVNVTVELPIDAVVGDTLVVTDGITSETIVLDADDISNGTVPATFTAPADGADITVTANITNVDGITSSNGTDTATVDLTAPSAPTVVIDEDANDDGLISDTELVGDVNVTVTLPGDAVAGDTLTITDGVNSQDILLSATDITNGTVSATVPAPAADGLLTVTANVTDAAGNAGPSANDAATVDTAAPSAPTVVIDEDANDDGLISDTELVGDVNVTVTLPGDAVAGDTLTITDGVNSQDILLSATDITNGTVSATVPAPAADGLLTVTANVTDVAGNAGPSANDAATVDTGAPSAPTVVIDEDANDDGLISDTELVGDVNVTVTLPGDAVAGDTLTITDGVNSQDILLSATDITNGTVSATVPAPAADGLLTVTANVTDVAGNAGPSANDAATVDTGAPSAPTVVIDEDANDDGLISDTELVGDVNVTVTLPGDAVAGDTLTITDGVNSQDILLSATDITNGTVSATVPAPAADGLLTVTANVTDAAGNAGPSANDAATVDTGAPSAPTVVIDEDANDDGLISDTELVGDVNVTVTLPGDAVAGDTLTITDGVNSQDILLSATDITNGTVSATVPAPAADGLLTVTANVTDVAGNAGPSANDAATVDTGAPSAPTVVIDEDANDDGLISDTELVGDVNVTVTLTWRCRCWRHLTITDGVPVLTRLQDILLSVAGYRHHQRHCNRRYGRRLLLTQRYRCLRDGPRSCC